MGDGYIDTDETDFVYGITVEKKKKRNFERKY